LHTWRAEFLAHFTHADVSNGPTESLNLKIKNTKRTARGFRNFGNYRLRLLLNHGRIQNNHQTARIRTRRPSFVAQSPKSQSPGPRGYSPRRHLPTDTTPKRHARDEDRRHALPDRWATPRAFPLPRPFPWHRGRWRRELDRGTTSAAAASRDRTCPSAGRTSAMSETSRSPPSLGNRTMPRAAHRARTAPRSCLASAVRPAADRHSTSVR
jgi:hypothetical protein